MVDIAVIGFGSYGWNLAEHVVEKGESVGCRLSAAADGRLAELEERTGILRRAGVELFDDAAAMLDAVAERCDAVYVATGIDSHAPLTIAAAGRGLHVLVEKPPAATIQDLDEMLSALDGAGTMGQVGFQQIHGEETRLLKQRVVEGALGTIRTVTCHACWPRTLKYFARNGWSGRLRNPAGEWVLDGPSTNALAHQVNNMLYVASTKAGGYAAPTSVRAELYAAGPIESHDTGAIEIRTEDGPTIYWFGTHCSREHFGPMIEVEGEKGRANWRPGEEMQIDLEDGTEEARRAANASPNMIANFAEAVAANDPRRLRCSLRATRAFVLSVNGAHESSGRIHRIDSTFHRVAGTTPEEQTTVIDGIDELVVRAAGEKRLFSELDGAPSWTRTTGPFDLRGYDRFPQRFVCD